MKLDRLFIFIFLIFFTTLTKAQIVNLNIIYCSDTTKIIDKWRTINCCVQLISATLIFSVKILHLKISNQIF
jgi:hypothetical protein